MSNIFSNGPAIFTVNDNTVPLLLLVSAETGPGSSNPFDEVNIMNFSTKASCDFQIQRSASGSFIYNSFGNSACQITLEGIQTPPSRTSSKTGGIEAYFNKANISGSKRTLIKITAAYTTPQTAKTHPETITYTGYMVGFRKKPMGQDKIPGYGFTLDLICRVMPKETKA